MKKIICLILFFIFLGGCSAYVRYEPYPPPYYYHGYYYYYPHGYYYHRGW